MFTTIPWCSQPFPYFHNHVLIFTTSSLFSQPFPYVHNHFFIFTTISFFSQPFPYSHNHIIIFMPMLYFFARFSIIAQFVHFGTISFSSRPLTFFNYHFVLFTASSWFPLPAHCHHFSQLVDFSGSVVLLRFFWFALSADCWDVRCCSGTKENKQEQNRSPTCHIAPISHTYNT